MSDDIPFQIEQLINGLFNPRDNIHVRGNYRSRLLTIKEACEKAIAKYDEELFRYNSVPNVRKKKNSK